MIAALGAGFSVQAIDFPLRWHWSNPGPHGNNIYDVAYDGSSGLAVQVADSGQVYTSYDLNTWTPQVSGSTSSLLGVTFWNSRCLMAGAYGTLLYADSPAAIQTGLLTTGATSDWLEMVAASPTLAVAVGDNFAIYTSKDGALWQRQNTAYTDWLRGVTYGAGLFVAVGETGTIATSVNGTNWIKQTSGTIQDLNRAIFTGNRFFAVGNAGTVLTSTSGVFWSAVATGSTNDLYAVGWDANEDPLIAGDGDVRLYDPVNQTWGSQIALSTNAAPGWTYYGAFGLTNFYLVAGQTGMTVGGVRTNTSACTWTVVGDTFRNFLWDLTFTNGLFVTVGDFGNVLTSDSGVDWNLELVPDSVTNSVFFGVGGTTNQLVVVGSAGSIILSTNAITNFAVTNIVGTNVVVTNVQNNTYGTIWTDVVPRPTTNDLQGVATLGNLFVVSGDNGTILTSPDGTTWTPQSTPTTEFLTSLVQFSGGLVAVGSSGTILTSPNAITWTPQASETTNWIYRVRNYGGKLIAVGQNGLILTSADGVNWTPSPSGTTEWLNDVSLVFDTNSTWFAVGTGGVILASSDAVNWTNLPSITEKSIYSAVFDGNRLLASGIEGIILRSLVVPFTNSVEVVTYSLTPGSGGQSDSLFQFVGLPDQRFSLDRTQGFGSTNTWSSTTPFEIFNTDGTLFYLETFEATNLPNRQFYRTTLKP